VFWLDLVTLDMMRSIFVADLISDVLFFLFVHRMTFTLINATTTFNEIRIWCILVRSGAIQLKSGAISPSPSMPR
jgi:hypothetical protein